MAEKSEKSPNKQETSLSLSFGAKFSQSDASHGR